MDAYQFYPTPCDLARRAWGKFKNKNFIRILEPSAGDGSLVTEMPGWNDSGHYRRRAQVDACEIDISKHPVLREKGIDVVGIDFMAFQNGAIYSHVILNPPFTDGVHHALKAWDLVWESELVAIINAATVRNPFSKERQRLVRLIEEHGEVEFIQDSFKGPGVEREADVEIALVYLKKVANIEEDIFGDLLTELAIDRENGAGVAGGFKQTNEVALPQSMIENQVACFNAAVASMQKAVFAEANAAHYSRLLGETMAERISDKKTGDRGHTADYVRKEVSERYTKLKDQAWASVLRSSNVTSRLSSKAQKRVESEFEQFKKLEFTVQNIYGFLIGIVESQGQIQIDMACDVFDLITRYHSDNTVFFKGWKSNDKHRTAGMKIKATRFVIPRNRADSHSLDWDSMQMLRDFDKIFAMVDGKTKSEVSLESVFDNHLRELKNGARLSSSYFDVRYYPGAQTIHFFAKDKKLIDRFNRLVGRHRQWLPPEGARVNDAFWLQFEKAEKFDKEVRTECKKGARSYWDDPLRGMFSGDEKDQAQACSRINEALDTVLERHGVNVDFQIEAQEALRLLAA